MRHIRLLTIALLIPAAALVLATFAGRSRAQVTPAQSGPGAADWPYYGNDRGGMRFSPLTQINRGNVARLKVAWVFHTGDVSNGRHTRRKTSFETTPVEIGGTLYFSTPFNRVIALDAATGRQKWAYDPEINLWAPYADGLINRGVSVWKDPTRAAGQPCASRVFIATIDARLIALDAATGKTCTDFGIAGEVNLKVGVGDSRPGEYEETSPPALIDNLVIVGSGIADNQRVNAPSGAVRAFDARTGALAWTFNPIPQSAADPAWKTWTNGGAQRTGAANTWAMISVDPKNDLVFLPTGSASPDYYGGERKGDGLYADSLVALRGSTGKVVWAFQTTHHDLWDYDNPAMPLLCTIRRDGVEIPAVVQGTKRASLFVFNRLTGQPVFPIVEEPVPQSDVPGEQTSPTQPFPTAPPPLDPIMISPTQAWGLTFWDRGKCRGRMEKLRSQGIFTPPSIAGSLVIPGNVGGMNWSGGAFDPENQLFITNTNNLVSAVHIIPRDELKQTYDASRGFGIEFAPMAGTPYGMSRVFMRSPLGLPCNPPPWGLLTAVDLSSGTIKWSVPLGDAMHLLHLPLPDPGWGLPNLGGAIVTAGGLVFVGGTLDPYFRAFDVDTGRMLWQTELPAGGNATPMTYRLKGGRQFVVIAAGGHGKLGSKQGDSLVAFALPNGAD